MKGLRIKSWRREGRHLRKSHCIHGLCGNLDLGKDRIVKKRKTEGMLMAVQNQAKGVSYPFVDCTKKERKQSAMWLENVKCLHKSITTYGDMIKLVLLFIG